MKGFMDCYSQGIELLQGLPIISLRARATSVVTLPLTSLSGALISIKAHQGVWPSPESSALRAFLFPGRKTTPPRMNRGGAMLLRHYR